MSNNAVYKASLAEYSYRIYESFLHKVFMDSSLGVPERHQILYYCFLHSGVSSSQLAIMFGSSPARRKATTMIVKRLREKNFMMCLKNLKTRSNKNGDSLENTYIITAAGINHCCQLLKASFFLYLPESTMSDGDYTYPLDDVLNYLSDRCLSRLPAYWNHYLAVRDINVYLMSSSFTVNNFMFETEVGLLDNGEPATLYYRALEKISRSYKVKCDGLLTYPISEDHSPFRFFIELDTGTQRSSILADKTMNYMDCFLTSDSFTPFSSLLFCLYTKVTEIPKDGKPVEKGYGNMHYYKFEALSCMIDLLNLYMPNTFSCRTIGDALALLRNKEGELTEPLKKLLKYFTDNTVNLAVPISMMKEQYYITVNRNTQMRNEMKNEINLDMYQRRRALLHKAVKTVHNIGTYLLKGFSIYSTPCYDIDGTFPFLLPEMFQFGNKLKRILLSLQLATMSDKPSYSPFYEVEGKDYVLRNAYTINNHHFVVENITDDIGGLFRIQSLLYKFQIPSSLSSTKVICLIDDYSVETTGKLYLNSPMGKLLSSRYGSRIEDGFEVLFATYDTIRTFGNLFTYTGEGTIVYKTI